jgi:hypothetical protein
VGILYNNHMSSWGARRRNRIISVFLLVVAAIILVSLSTVIDRTPSCFDGVRNGDEQGRDCGGGCKLFCEGQSIDPLVHWSRSFPVAPGIYNAVAYLENLNTEAGSRKLEYIFRAYDKDNVLIADREGEINLNPKEIIPIVENAINVGKREISRTTFTILNDLVWERQERKDREIVISDERLFDVEGLPRISAEVTNISINKIEDIDVIVIIYDKDGNAISTSSTVIESISKDQKRDIVYTWPRPFAGEAFRFEIIPLYESSN